MKKYIIFGGILLSFFIIYQCLKRSEYFKMGNPIVNGLNRIKREEILKITSIKTAMNILNLDIKGIRDNIASHPWVSNVSVRREFPDRLIIDIIERNPLAIININGLFYVDNNGEIFKRVEINDNPDYPIITGINKNDSYSSFMKKIKRGVSFIFIAKPLINIISEVNVSNGIIIYTIDGITVNIGESDYKEKINRLNKILIDLKKRSIKVKVIDLDYKDRGIIKTCNREG